VDGDLQDWGRQGLVVAFSDPDPRGNHVTARLVWDREALYAAFEVTDPAVFAPPPEAPASNLYQWDSVELYIRPGSHSGVMDSGDLQLIITSSGQIGALRGDEFLASAGWEVPKREVKRAAVAAASQTTATGYSVECSAPWAMLGIEPPAAGQVLRLDIANNNWLEDHPPLPEAVLDFDNLLTLTQANPVDKTLLHLDDPEEIGWEAGRAIIERAYLAWSWSGTRDLGFPATWHNVTLTGGPHVRERVVTAMGATGLVAAAGSSVALVAGVVLVIVGRRNRRRITSLVRRLRELEEQRPAPDPARATQRIHPEVRYEPLSSAIDRVRSLVQKGDPIPGELCGRVIAFIVLHLHRAITPQEVAAGVHVSVRTLQRSVSSSLGCTPSELITAVRMREAQRLLTRDGMLVKEVAARVGFVSVSHFSRSFKHYFQVPPSEVSAGQHPTFGPRN
jgi:AraC-like DNA-binding protein